MTMAEQMLYTQMNRAADRHRLYRGLPARHRAGLERGLWHGLPEGTDDGGFTQAVLAKVKHDYRVDARRVYATGLSRGGFLRLRLAAELPHLFAAVASVGGPCPNRWSTPCRTGKVGVLLIHGTADQVVAYGGKARLPVGCRNLRGTGGKVNGIDRSAPAPRIDTILATATN